MEWLVVGGIVVVSIFALGFRAGYVVAAQQHASLWRHGYNLGVSNTSRALSKSREAIKVLIHKRRRGRMTT